MTGSRQSNAGPHRPLGAAVGAAVAASICCVGPLVLIGLGASGAWLSGLSILEPVKPLLTLATGGFLGWAFARVYSKPAPQACEPGSACADPRTDRINKVILWVVTVLITALLMVPTMMGWAVASNDEASGPTGAAESAAPGRERVVLSLENMTCSSCSHTVRKALGALRDVTVVEVTSDPPRAVVEYDPKRVRVEELVKATTDVGYPSSLIVPR